MSGQTAPFYHPVSATTLEVRSCISTFWAPSTGTADQNNDMQDLTSWGPWALAVALLSAACSNPAQPGGVEEPTGPNTLTSAERAAGWRLLFDGSTTAGWRGFRQAAVPGGWQAVDGALTRTGGGGDLITLDQFAQLRAGDPVADRRGRKQRHHVPRQRSERRHASDRTGDAGPRQRAPPGRPKPAELGRRLLRALRPVAGRDPAGRRLERRAPRRQRRAHRALAERGEDRRVRDRKPRLAVEARRSVPFATSPHTPASREAISRSRTMAIAWRTAGSRSDRCRSVSPTSDPMNAKIAIRRHVASLRDLANCRGLVTPWTVTPTPSPRHDRPHIAERNQQQQRAEAGDQRQILADAAHHRAEQVRAVVARAATWTA